MERTVVAVDVWNLAAVGKADGMDGSISPIQVEPMRDVAKQCAKLLQLV